MTEPYGKTGMGKAEGIVVDAWFTGFAETLEGNKYFCVYLGQSDAGNTSSTAAKEIAIQILNDNKWQKITIKKSPQTLTGWAIFL